MKGHCCEDISYHANFACGIHDEPSDCPDQLLSFDEKDHTYGLLIHDGGTSSITISFCPWCGSKL